MKPILLNLDPTLHEALKKAAAADSRSVSSACRAAIAAYIADVAKKGAGK